MRCGCVGAKRRGQGGEDPYAAAAEARAETHSMIAQCEGKYVRSTAKLFLYVMEMKLIC